MTMTQMSRSCTDGRMAGDGEEDGIVVAWATPVKTKHRSSGGETPQLVKSVTVRHTAPTLRDPDSPEICPTDAYFKLFRWRPTCTHLVAHQPQLQFQYFPGIHNPLERAPT